MPGDTLFSIGEALIDMIPSKVGCSFDEVPSFSPRTGGAPANVCAAFTRLGGKSAFLSQLGNDPFGHKIARELTDCGIEGFWNDMNEPALFYSPDRLKAFLDSMHELRGQDNIVQEEFFARVVGGAMGLMNAPEDYAKPLPICAPASAPCCTAAAVLSAATAMAASGWATTIPAGSSCWPTSR